MKYAVYKFEFQTGVHFGTGRLNETTYVFHADQLFSALYIEALKSGVADRFYQDVIQGKLILSDGMPHCTLTETGSHGCFSAGKI